MTADAVLKFNEFVEALGENYAPAKIYAASAREHAFDSPIWDLKDLLDHLEAGKGPSNTRLNYCAGLIASVKPTGYSSHLDGCFCMGVTTAMYFCCTEMSITCMQSEHMFKDVGELKGVTQERGRSEMPSAWGFRWRDELEEWYRQHCQSADFARMTFDAWTIPSYAEKFTVACPIRKACAEYLMRMMITFLWHHEFAHVISGHLPYLRELEQVENKTLSENDFWFEKTQEEKYLYAAIRLWIEHDADTCAVRGLLLNNLQGIKIHPTGHAEIDGNPALRARLDIVAFLLVLLIIYFQYDWKEATGGTHPDPLKRIAVVVLTCADFLLKNSPDGERVARAVAEEIQGLARASTNHLFLIPMFFGPPPFNYLAQEYNDLLAQVAEIIPQVRKHSFFDANGLIALPEKRPGFWTRWLDSFRGSG
jgi:hypothetical protein